MGLTIKNEQACRGWCLFLVVGALIFGKSPSLAQTVVPAPKSVFSLASSPSTLQGEPVLLRYNLRNSSGQRLLTNFGNANDQWFRLKLVDETGKSAALKKVLDSEWPFGFRGVEYSPRMEPGEERADTIVVTRYFDIPHPGKWTLTAETNMAVLPVPEGVVRTGPGSALKEGRTVPAEATVFVITVLPSRSSQLRTIAENLRKTALTEPDRKRRRLATVSLFSMPERDVWPVWEALARSPAESHTAFTAKYPSTRAIDLAKSEIAKALGKVSTRHSAEILAFMHENHLGGDSPGLALYRMSEQVEGELKEYVESLLRKISSSDHPIKLYSSE